MTYIGLFPLRLDSEGLVALSRAYVNKDDGLFGLFEKIEKLDGYEDFLIHGEPDKLIYETNNGVNTYYSASEFADILKEDEGYHGGNIRLLACNSGSLRDGFAQQLANELGRKVLAPSEILWIKEDGALFITNSEILADMWNNGENVQQTGEWVLFEPQ